MARGRRRAPRRGRAPVARRGRQMAAGGRSRSCGGMGQPVCGRGYRKGGRTRPVGRGRTNPVRRPMYRGDKGGKIHNFKHKMGIDHLETNRIE